MIVRDIFDKILFLFIKKISEHLTYIGDEVGTK